MRQTTQPRDIANTSEQFPAGRYYVGDLCYAIMNWDRFCELTLKDDGIVQGDIPWRGERLWQHSTAWGDGVFQDAQGRQYGVDAGLIGILPVEFVDKDQDEFVRPSNDLGHIVEFKTPFTCTYENGCFYFGDSIVIDTDPQEDDEDQEDEDDYCSDCLNHVYECVCDEEDDDEE